MKRRNYNGFDVLANILESVGVENMVNDSDVDSDDDSDSEHIVDWVQRAISDAHAHAESREMTEVPATKRTKRTWTCRKKLPYSSSPFYRDYHNPSVQDLIHRDSKRISVRLPNALVGSKQTRASLCS